jgi:hypothetical protein
MQYVNGKLGKEVGRLVGWRHGIWSGHYTAIAWPGALSLKLRPDSFHFLCLLFRSVVRNLTGSRNVGASPTSQVPISMSSGKTVQTVHSRAGRFAVTEKERRPDVSGPGRVSANGLGTSLQRSTGA